ncbi:MAG: response regulator [Candidatus Omnitrophota bacterium]|nr:response regulator [Candidatus Omnitrophota bacterium]MDZ4242992.1 response regulator [Candidatus Omnitrophota bacterium]
MDRKKILIVDDDTVILDILEKKLLAEGFQVIKASGGRESVTKAKYYLPDLILMDIVLPDLDGPEAVRLIRENPSLAHIPVLFLSGIVTNSNKTNIGEITVAGRQYQAVAKPFQYHQLHGEIMKILK